jgi:hypothetical protein
MPVMSEWEVVDAGCHHMMLEDASLGLSPVLISHARGTEPIESIWGVAPRCGVQP